MEELLAFLFAAAIRYSDLPPMEGRPPVQAMPYKAMLLEVCADLKADIPRLQRVYSQCTGTHQMMPSMCDDVKSQTWQYDQCIQQRGLMAAYLIGQNRIVYREDLDLQNDSDNSFIVHEYVHALQDHHFGQGFFDSCEGVFNAEKQAYGAQQEYLVSRGQLLRVGERLRFVSCKDIR